jgi:hypothetical protein
VASVLLIIASLNIFIGAFNLLPLLLPLGVIAIFVCFSLLLMAADIVNPVA